MNNITKEQILRLEKVGSAIIDCIGKEYTALNNSMTNQKKLINELYSDFGKTVDKVNKEEVYSADEDR